MKKGAGSVSLDGLSYLSRPALTSLIWGKKMASRVTACTTTRTQCAIQAIRNFFRCDQSHMNASLVKIMWWIICVMVILKATSKAGLMLLEIIHDAHSRLSPTISIHVLVYCSFFSHNSIFKKGLLCDLSLKRQKRFDISMPHKITMKNNKMQFSNVDLIYNRRKEFKSTWLFVKE